MKWFRDARFGMFIHWGLHSQLGGEWKHKNTPRAAEWVQEVLAIPTSPNAPLVQSFDARLYDADA